MGLVISKGLTLRKRWQPMDTDAAAYITAVETADGQALEEKTKIAIDNFVLGCKADGIWTAIKASCILAGARTLTGALVPLAGTAPTNFNFVSGDYNRKTGLVGDGSTKYLDSNRNTNSDPRDNNHMTAYATNYANYGYLIGSSGAVVPGFNSIQTSSSITVFRSRFDSGFVIGVAATNNFIGISRASSASFSYRYNGATANQSTASQLQADRSIRLFQRNNDVWSDSRLAFYSIGESLNLALLDARVTDLINAFAAAIP
jgi:hypothetical protein